MKIQDILEHTFPEIKERNVSRLPKNYNQNPDPRSNLLPRIAKRRQHLGTGAFASTYSTDNNPHDVLKMSRRMAAPEKAEQSDIDGFYYYLKALSDGKDFVEGDSTANPYYPRFRNIRIYRKGDKMAYTVQVERLTDLDSLQPAEGIALWRKLFGEEPQGSTSAWIVENLAERLSQLAKYGVEEGNKIDKNLKRALIFIQHLKSKHYVDVDLHPGNIMIRRTPYGPQLVITDPLGYRRDYNFSNRTPQHD